MNFVYFVVITMTISSPDINKGALPCIKPPAVVVLRAMRIEAPYFKIDHVCGHD